MWHPETESEACCELAAMLEFFRATRRLAGLTPQALRRWWDADPRGFVDAFAEYDPHIKTAANPADRIAAVFAEFDQIRP